MFYALILFAIFLASFENIFKLKKQNHVLIMLALNFYRRNLQSPGYKHKSNGCCETGVSYFNKASFKDGGGCHKEASRFILNPHNRIKSYFQ